MMITPTYQCLHKGRAITLGGSTNHVSLLHAEVHSGSSCLCISGVQLKCFLVAAPGSALVFGHFPVVVTQVAEHRAKMGIQLGSLEVQ